MSLSKISLLIESGENLISVQSQLIERTPVLSWIERWVARVHSLPCYVWNLGQGKFRQILPTSDHKFELNSDDFFKEEANVASHSKVLDFLLEQPEDGVFILEDLQPFLTGFPAAELPSRMCSQRLISQLVNISQKWVNQSKYLVLLGTQEVELPPSLGSLIPEVWNPLPDFHQIITMLIDFLPQLGSIAQESLIAQLALSAGGMTLEEIKTGLRIGKARTGGVDSRLIEQLLNYKIERLRSFNLQFVPQPDVPDFGGLDRIKTGITEVRSDYTTAARASGLPLPKGWLLVGPPGTGKTFVSKFCAKALSFPMISVDTGAVSAGGASYLKRLIARVEAAAPTVVYFDEFDKLFPGSNQISEDVNQRQVLGLLLTWLQDKTSKTFVIATLNRLDALPPELTRVGRFDEIYSNRQGG